MGKVNAAWATLRESYRGHLVAGGYSASAVRQYIACASEYAQWCQRERVGLLSVRYKDVQRYVREERSRVSASRAETAGAAVRGFYRWAVASGLIENDPTLRSAVARGLLPTAKAAAAHGMNRSWLTRLLRDGSVDGVQEDGWWFVDGDSLQSYLDGREAGQRFQQGGDEWQGLLQGFQAYMLGQGRSPLTVKTYLYKLTKYAEWCEQQGLAIVGAGREQIERYYAMRLSQSHEAGLCSLFALRALHGYMMAHGRQADDPTAGLRARKLKRQPRQPFTLAECRKLLAAAVSPLERALILTFVASGMRRAELLGMRVEDIDWERGAIMVNGKGMRQRLVSLGRSATDAIRIYLDGRLSGLVWIGPRGAALSKSTLLRCLSLLAARAQVSKVHPHRFRTSFANMFLAEGGDIQSLQVLMGHANIAQTAYYSGYYASQRALALQQSMGLADRLEGR